MFKGKLKNSICGSILLFTLLAIACKSEDHEVGQTPAPMVDAIYPLSNNSKALFDHYYQYSEIGFQDQADQEIKFSSTSYRHQTQYPEGSLPQGEQLLIRYTCETGYIADFHFTGQLKAMDSTRVKIYFFFAAGYPHPRSGTTTHTEFTLFPDSLDQRFATYHDSLTIRSTKFYKVYHIKSNFGMTPTSDCYYNHDLGLLAFKNIDDRLWVRKD